MRSDPVLNQSSRTNTTMSMNKVVSYLSTKFFSDIEKFVICNRVNCKDCNVPIPRSKSGPSPTRCSDCKVIAKNSQRLKWRIKNKNYEISYSNKYCRTTRGRYNRLCITAKRRGINIRLSLDEFKTICDGICVYCNGLLDTDTGAGSRLDRLDSNKDYSIDNVCCCCGLCNAIKGDRLTPQETKAAVDAILKIRFPNLDGSVKAAVEKSFNI